MSEFTLRPMTADDFTPLAAWMVEVPLWQRYGLRAERAAANFAAAHTRGEILIAADRMADRAEDRACGFAWIVPHGAFGRSAYLRLIGVRPDCAGGGLGGLLLARAEQEALAFGDALFLLVSDFNTDAQRFYTRHGYVQAGAISGYVLPNVVELLLWKRLKT